VIDREPVGIGRKNTPTPSGLYYTKELLRPPNPDGPYGAYAYGLSGFSNVLSRFDGGDGVIGIHGTNDPSGLGKDVSHGCIRMSNAGVTKLARILPLGVPIEIVP
jgi:lipoprotein-anchoring transpeptidase ErfK/SrfK